MTHERSLAAAWLEKEVFGLHAAEAILPLNWVGSLHVLRGLQELGKKPGRDIPFISFDDLVQIVFQTGRIQGVIYGPASYARAFFYGAAGMRRVHISGLLLGRWEIHPGHNGICASSPHQVFGL